MSRKPTEKVYKLRLMEASTPDEFCRMVVYGAVVETGSFDQISYSDLKTVFVASIPEFRTLTTEAWEKFDKALHNIEENVQQFAMRLYLAIPGLLE